MRKLMFCLVVLGLLSGFYLGEPHQEYEQNGTMERNKTIVQAGFSTEPSKSIALLPPDGTLQVPGETITDELGKLTLIAISPVYDSYRFGGLELIVKDVKHLQFIPANKDFPGKEEFSNKAEIHLVKIDIELINQHPHTLTFDPVNTIRANSKTISPTNEILSENMGGQLGGGETKIGSLAYILDDPDLKLDDILISTSNVTFNKKEINKAATLRFAFRQP